MSENVNIEEELTPEKFEAMMREQEEARMKVLQSKVMPATRDLAGALSMLSHAELMDIAFNLNVTEDENIDDEELCKMLSSSIQDFAKSWLTTIVEDQMALFDFIVEHGGVTTEIRSDDGRLDYLRGIGMVFCGMNTVENKLAWYMAEEIVNIYKEIKSDAFVDMVRLNDEIMQLSAGLVFYYGMLDYDKLFAKIKEYTEADLEFSAFMGIIYNGSEWCPTVAADKHELYNTELLDLDKLRNDQKQREGVDYLEIPYDRAFEAGEEHHIESTAEYRKLAQHMMKEFKLDVMQVADILRNVNSIIQNGYGMNDVIGFLAGNVEIKSKEQAQELAMLVAEYSNTLPMWVLKGHSPVEINAVKKPRRAVNKIGRNDPCPCGSGKKYKNCCLNKIH